MPRIMRITSIKVDKETHTEILKVVGQIQARMGKTVTIDEALRELLENYKKKTRS